MGYIKYMVQVICHCGIVIIRWVLVEQLETCLIYSAAWTGDICLPH